MRSRPRAGATDAVFALDRRDGSVSTPPLPAAYHSTVIDHRVVDHVARLARLELTPEERERFTRQLAALLEYFAVLQRLDTEGVAPTAHIVELTNVLRDDTPRPGLPRAAALAGAPEQEDGFFKVPPVIEPEAPP